MGRKYLWAPTQQRAESTDGAADIIKAKFFLILSAQFFDHLFGIRCATSFYFDRAYLQTVMDYIIRDLQ